MDELERGAQAAVEQCMAITEDDRVLIVADEASKNIGLAIRKEVLKRTNFVRFYNIDLPAYGGRPLKRMPKELWNTLPEITASFFVADAQEGELESIRAPLLKKLVQTARHAHMVGVSEEIMRTGMSVNYEEVAIFTNALCEKLMKTTEITVNSDAGTDFKVGFKSSPRWIPETGLIHHKGEWDNLPAGEVFTAPKWLEGRIVANGSLGDWLGVKYEGIDLDATPLILDVVKKDWGILEGIECQHPELLKDFTQYVDSHPYARRVGELGLGTNHNIKEIIGNILQDEKFPSVHVAFGDPYEEKTMVGWTCPFHMDLVLKECNVWLDDTMIMENGKYLKNEIL